MQQAVSCLPAADGFRHDNTLLDVPESSMIISRHALGHVPLHTSIQDACRQSSAQPSVTASPVMAPRGLWQTSSASAQLLRELYGIPRR